MSRTILLADDSVTIQKVVELTFMDQDYEVIAVSDGKAALEWLSQQRPALLIADVHMPGADGYEVCRSSKEIHADLPVLLLVGTFEPFDEGQAAASGADGHLKKPFDSQDLLSQVDALASGSAPVPAPAAAEPPPVAEVPEISDLEPPPLTEDSAGAEVASMAGMARPMTEDASAVPPAPSLPTFDLPDTDEASSAEPLAAPEEVDHTVVVDPAPPVEMATPAVEAEPPPEVTAPEPEAPAPDDTASEASAVASADEAPEEATPPDEPAAAASAESAGSQAAASNGSMSDHDVDRVARRVAELVGEKLLREVAWEVVPDLAELIIKERIRELESQVE